MNTKYIILFCSIFLGNSAMHAQLNKEEYAANLYSSFSFVKAAEVYEEILDKNERKSEASDRDMLLKAAKSFYNARSYNKAYKYYNSAHQDSILEPNDFICYLDCALRIQEDLKDSDLIALSANYEDNAGQSLRNVATIRNSIIADSAGVSIYPFQYNSGKGDYFLTEHNGALYFCSSRKAIGYTHEAYEWDNLNYSNLFVLQDGDIKPFKQANSMYHDGPICFDDAHNRVYLTRTETKKEGTKHTKRVQMYVCHADSISADSWKPFQWNASGFSTGHATVSKNGDYLVFASDRNAVGVQTDLYFCKWENGSWTEPMPLGESVNTLGDEMFPWFDENDVLFYSSNGLIGLGGLDVYAKEDAFDNSPPVNLGLGINSSSDDFAFYKKEASNSGFFTSDRAGSIDKIYAFEQKEISGTLLISVIDGLKNKPLESPDVYVINVTDGDTTTVARNEAGLYPFEARNNKDYVLIANEYQYELDELKRINTDAIRNNEEIPVKLTLTQTQYDLSIRSVIKGSDQPCPFVAGTFKDPVSGEIIPFVTDSLGIAKVNITIGNEYDLRAQKKGFIDLEQSVTADNTVLLELDLTMQEIKEDFTYKIENIFYDLDKATLRDSSKIELDKLARFLEVNETIRIELGSHSDSRGSSAYNKSLSQRRAQSCVDYLIENGIDSGRISAKGYGESRLVNKCRDGVKCSDEEHQENRRTEVKILDI